VAPRQYVSKKAAAAAAAPPPGKDWRPAASTAVIIIEVILLVACLWQAFILLNLRSRSDSLAQTQKQSEKIRQAWSDLAGQGAMLRSRIDKSNGKLTELTDYIRAAAKQTGLEITFYGPQQVRKTGSVTTTSIIIRARAPEKRIFKFLLAMDKAPTIAETDLLELVGEPKGLLSMKLSLLHYDYSPAILKELRAFVASLPSVPGSYEHKTTRDEKLFLPHLIMDESAVRGWPKVQLSGFSEDKAVMVYQDQAKTYALGESISDGYVYSEKLSVNQAVLKRTRDNAEVIVTIGSRSYALRASEVRGMSEFVLTLQKRQPVDFAAEAGK
jgi:hypothetical protein